MMMHWVSVAARVTAGAFGSAFYLKIPRCVCVIQLSWYDSYILRFQLSQYPVVVYQWSYTVGLLYYLSYLFDGPFSYLATKKKRYPRP